MNKLTYNIGNKNYFFCLKLSGVNGLMNKSDKRLFLNISPIKKDIYYTNKKNLEKIINLLSVYIIIKNILSCKISDFTICIESLRKSRILNV